MKSRLSYILCGALFLSWLLWVPKALAQVSVTTGGGKYNYTYSTKTVGHSYRGRVEGGGWSSTNDYNSSFDQTTAIDESIKQFLEDMVTYTPDYTSHTGADQHYTMVSGSGIYTTSMAEDVSSSVDISSGHTGETVDAHTITTIEQYPAPDGLENPRTTYDDSFTDNGARSVFGRSMGSAFACKTNYTVTTQSTDPDVDSKEETTYKGSESYYAPLVVDEGTIPEGQVAYLDYSITYYDYYFYPELRYFNFSTGRRDYHIKLSSLGGTWPIIDPSRIFIYDNSCRVITVTAAAITFENTPGSPGFVAAAVAPPLAPSFDSVSGRTIYETNYLRKTPPPTQEVLNARVAARIAAKRNYYNTVIRPNFVRLSAVLRNWFFNVTRELKEILMAMQQGAPFRMPRGCAGYTDLGRCLTENMNPYTSPVLRATPTPTPTPTPRPR